MGKATETNKDITPQKVNESIAENPLKFENRIIINGEAVKTSPKKVDVKINGQQLTLKCRIIPDDFIATAYSNSFIVPVIEKDIQVSYAKGGGLLAASLYVDGKLEYSGISMQSIFAIIEAGFGVGKLTVDRLYIASNANRKKPPEAKQEAAVTP